MSGGKRHSLSDREYGGVGGLLRNPYGLEEPVHRMRRIGKAETAQRIGDEQMTVLGGSARRRHGVVAQQCRAKQYWRACKEQHRPARPSREPQRGGPDPRLGYHDKDQDERRS